MSIPAPPPESAPPNPHPPASALDPRPASTPPAPTPPPTPPAPTPSPDSATSQVGGTTEVLAAVVAKIAATTARDVRGVTAVGGTGAQALGAVRRGLAGDAVGESFAGVRVAMENLTARLAIDVVVDYRIGAPTVVPALRRRIPEAVAVMAEVRVLTLDIVIVDVQLPEEASSGT